MRGATLVPSANIVGAAPSTTASCPVLICLLGNFAILKGGQPLPLRHANKTKLMLINLARERSYTVSRERLLQSLWPDVQIELASQSLHSLVHGLRRHLSDSLDGAAPVIYVEGCYRLNVESGIGVDIDLFDRFVQEGQQHERIGRGAAALQAFEYAVQIYRGDLCNVSDTQSLVLCEALRAQYLSLLAHLADYYFDHCDYAACLSHAMRLLSVDPCREDAHRLAMRCYVRQGQRAQALQQYRMCASILRTEFEAAPEAGTEELYHQIRNTPEQI